MEVKLFGMVWLKTVLYLRRRGHHHHKGDCHWKLPYFQNMPVGTKSLAKLYNMDVIGGRPKKRAHLVRKCEFET